MIQFNTTLADFLAVSSACHTLYQALPWRFAAGFCI